MASSAKNETSKNEERDEIDELQKTVAVLIAETRDLYFNKIAGADREIEAITKDIELTEKDTRRFDELSAELDVQTKFCYQNFTSNRDNIERMKKSYSRLVGQLHKLEAELNEAVADLNKTKSYWKDFCSKQELILTERQNSFANIGWASKYKKVFDENQRLLERKTRTEQHIVELETKIKDVENELRTMARDELPWNKVCIQFSETMLKNMQMKKDIRSVERDIASLTLSNKKIQGSPKGVLSENHFDRTVRSITPEKRFEKAAVVTPERSRDKTAKAITPEKLRNKTVLVPSPEKFRDSSNVVVSPGKFVKTPQKRPVVPSPEIPEKRFANVAIAESIASDSTSDIIRVDIDKESDDASITDEVPMRVDDLAAYAKQGSMNATFPFETSPAANDSNQTYDFMNMFNMGGGNFNDIGSNAFFNVFNQEGKSGGLEGEKTPESSNDGGGFFGMFGNFGGGKSPASASVGSGGFPFNFGGGNDKSADEEDSANGGFGLFRF